MDRNLSAGFRKKRNRKLWLTILITISVSLLSFLSLRTFIRPSVRLSDIQVDTAEVGIIEATIPAMGLIVPEYEFLISSPVNTRIEQVYRHAGDSVNIGDSILRLNKENTQTNFDKLLHEQEMNLNKINQLKLNLERTLNESKTQYSIKEMKIKSLESSLEHERSLFKIGGEKKFTTLVALPINNLSNQISFSGNLSKYFYSLQTTAALNSSFTRNTAQQL